MEPADVLDAARELLPDRALTAATALGEGLDHRTFLIDDHLVARVANDPEDDLRVEAERLRRIAELSPVPVPTPLAARADLLLHPLLVGTPLLRIAPERRRATGRRAAADLGAMLAALWAEPLESARALFDTDDTSLRAWHEEASETVARLGDVVPARLRPPVAAWLAEPVPGDAERLVLSHNDLGAEHVLVDERRGRVSGVIDWSDAAVVDPAKDLGVLLRDLGDGGLGIVLDRVRPVIETTPDLLRRARSYALCLALEDLDFARANDRPQYVAPALEAVERLAAA